jgi:hypothetical protein
VTVHEGNFAPVAVNDTVVVTPSSGTATLDLLANDTDADGDIVNISEITEPIHGIAAIGSMGANVTYTPPTGFVGVDTFNYTLTDGLASTTGTAAVVVDTAPTAAADIVRVRMNSINNPIDVLANDGDIDGQVLFVSAVSTPDFGTASVGPFGGSVVYTPPAGFQGEASFTYTVTDNILSSTGTVIINVAPEITYLPLIFR